MERYLKGSIAALLALSLGGAAQAAPIQYIFTGVGTGTLNGTAFSGSFTVTETGDTTSVAGPFGGEFTNVASTATFVAGALTATLTGTTNEVLDNTAAPGFVGFGQFPAIAIEATINAAFETYDLTTALPLTIGTPSTPINSTPYATSAGDLIFTDITALDFQAVVPEPASFALMGMALAGLGVVRRRRRSARE